MPIYERPTVPEGAEKWAMVVERIEYKNGIQVYIKDHKYPFKGMATEPAVNAIAIIKKLLKFQPIQAMWTAIQPHILKEEFQMPMTKELMKMFPGKIGTIIAHTFEYDSAYRFFTQDLLHESDKDRLLDESWSEIHRLIAINARRCANNPDARKKMKYTLYICLFLLYLPWFRKALRNCTFENLQPDEGDLYWISKRTDYLVNA